MTATLPAPVLDTPAVRRAPAALRLDDRVLITGGGHSGEYARVVYLYGDGRYDLLGEGLTLLVKYPRHILRKVG